MLTSLTVPVLTLLISIPGLGGLPGFRVRMPHKPAPADTLPPAWKPASRLALENEFVFATLPRLGGGAVALKLESDPRRLRVNLDPDSGAISVVPEMGEVQLGRSARHSLAAYSRDMTWENFKRQWGDRSRQSINTLTPLTSTAPHAGISLQLPSPLPKRIQGWLGPGGPALNVSGS